MDHGQKVTIRTLIQQAQLFYFLVFALRSYHLTAHYFPLAVEYLCPVKLANLAQLLRSDLTRPDRTKLGSPEDSSKHTVIYHQL